MTIRYNRDEKSKTLLGSNKMSIMWIKGEKKGQEEYKDAVLFKGEKYLGHDRYLDYAEVWDGKCVRTVTVGHGYCTMNEILGVTVVDASPLSIEKARNGKKAAQARAAKLEAERRAKIEAETVRKGKEVEVFKGRKVPVGTKGRVFWMGNNGWGMSVGIETKEGDRMFTALSNVKIVS